MVSFTCGKQKYIFIDDHLAISFPSSRSCKTWTHRSSFHRRL